MKNDMLSALLKFICVFAGMVTLVFLMSCSGVSFEQMGRITKGMTPLQAAQKIGSSPLKTFELIEPIDGKKITVQAYRVSYGDYRSDFYLTYMDDQLYYWGCPHEYNRSENAVLNQIGEKACKMYDDYTKKREQKREAKKSI